MPSGLELTTAQWLTHATLLAVNLGFFFGARRLIERTQANHDHSERVQLSRMLSGLICLLILANILVLSFASDYSQVLMRVAYSLMTVYAGLVIFQLASYYSLRRFGRKREHDDKELFHETYSSRLMNIVVAVLIGIAVLYALIKLWGADSMLETTGVFGIIFAFLAFTSGQWAPDIISGLVILNSQTLEDGDLVRIDGYDDEYIINKVSFIYSILFDIRNNNRTLIRNHRILQGKIDNLSRIASTDGIRQALVYKLGYPDMPQGNRDARLAILRQHQKDVDDMFQAAYERACEDESVKINPNRNFEWALTEAGDFALHYTLWIYLERIPSTKVTATIRRHYLGTIYRVNQLVYDSAVAEGLDLSTPNLASVRLQTMAQSSPLSLDEERSAAADGSAH